MTHDMQQIFVFVDAKLIIFASYDAWLRPPPMGCSCDTSHSIRRGHHPLIQCANQVSDTEISSLVALYLWDRNHTGLAND